MVLSKNCTTHQIRFLTAVELTTDPNLTYGMLEQVISSAKEKHLKPRKVKFNYHNYNMDH